jgi:hypothetical protein
MGSHSSDQKGDVIMEEENLPFEEQELTKYAEGVVMTKNLEMVVRFHFEANQPLYMFKRNTSFMDWLKENDVRIEENNLRKMYCVKLGFLTGSFLRDATVKIHEKRSKNCSERKWTKYHNSILT